MKGNLRRFILIELGTFTYALAVGMFILPGRILSGGVAGITALLNRFIVFDADIMTIIINTVLYLLGALVLGRDFALNTLAYSVSYPFFLLFVTRILPAYDLDPLLAAVYGGAVGGIGLALIFRNGGSSGGMDVLALITDNCTHIGISRAIMLLDGITVLAGLLTYGLEAVLIGLICVFITTLAINYGMNAYRGSAAIKFEIISDAYQQIADEVHEIIGRGTSIIDIEGGYTGQKRKMVIAVVSEDQYARVKSIIEKNDSNAFVIISDTKDVRGEGFTYAPRL